MMRSASCFKLIVCAGDDDDYQERVAAARNESTVLSDKRRWSFRRKSSSERVIIHTVVTNTPSGNGESVDLVSTYLPASQPIAPEKSSLMHLNNEDTNLSMNAFGIGASENQNVIIADVEESTVTLIQTAVRRFLAQRELFKLKMLVKLQATVRGHLVRQNAVGSLHCIRAIVKMQALVRARYGKCSGKSVTEGKAKADADSTSKISTSHCYIVLDKLLSNSFVRQLTESTPNPKHFNIKCDSSSPCPAWSWMERWMSFASPTMGGTVLEIEQEQKTNEKTKASHEEDRKASKNNDTFGSKITVDDYGKNNLVPPIPLSTSHLLGDNKEQFETVNAATSVVVAMKASLDMVQDPKQNVPSATKLLAEMRAQCIESEVKTTVSNRRVALELHSKGAKNIIGGSRKRSNPSFTAAQSKFKELTSTGSTLSYNQLQDAEHDSKGDTAKIRIGITSAKMEFSQSDSSSKFIGGSECGTELSITSALDSPDDGSYIELSTPRILDGKMPDEGTYIVIKDGAISSNDTSTFDSKQDKHDYGFKKSGDAKKDDKMLQKKLKGTKFDARFKLKTQSNLQLNSSSVKASPRNLDTSPGSQGTPTSQLVAKSGNTRNSGSRKRKNSFPSVKKSSSSSARDSEQLNQKVDRRRSSLGSDASDLFELERTDNSGSVSLPSYMKATVSAKARLFASTSPRLSPDVLEKVISLTKRHSLPVANVKQISPKLQQPSTGNGTSTQERKWQR